MLDPYFPTPEIEDKVRRKHNIRLSEISQVFQRNPRIFLRAKKDRYGDRIFRALGRTLSGRYVVVFFVTEPGHMARVITAREMQQEEKRRYHKR